MIQQTIVWTAIPNGVSDGGKPIVTVFISPQLKTDALPGKLGQFKDFLDWPAVLAKLQFKVELGGGGTREAKRPSDQTDSKLWTAIFHSGTFVRPYEFKRLDDRLIFSFPVRNVHDFLKEKYQKYAISDPETFPSKEPLAADFGRISFFRPGPNFNATTVPTQQEDQAIIEGIKGRMKRENAIYPTEADPPSDFFLLKWFHAPKNKRDPDTPTSHNNKPVMRQGRYKRAVVKPPELDFHQAISTLGNYPALLRKMGLAFDLEIEGPPIPPSATVRVVPIWPSGLPSLAPDDKRPKTHYILSGKNFVAKPRQTEPEVTESGLLRLRDGPGGDPKGTPLYSLVQVDVDGAAMKTMNFAYNLFATEMRRTVGSPENVSLPSIRTGGISIVRTGRALRTARHLKGATRKYNDVTGGTDPELFAEDITRGYRVDVYDVERGKWFSLCRRVGRYEFTSAGHTEELTDEGMVQTGAMSSADDTTNDLYLHESFATWEGWSLCAPRPGAAINNEGEVENSPKEFSEEFKLRTWFRPEPGTLPMLRFGRKYRVRIRAVDLAGGGPTLEEPNPTDFSNVTDEIFYARFEPLTNPFLVLKKPLDGSPGESLERLVIRSFNTTLELDTTATAETSERHVAPPSTVALNAETHGVFDLPASAMTDENLKKQYDLISSKEGRFKATGPHDLKNPPNPIDTSDIVTELPYLPEPFAHGAVFFNLPGAPAGKILQIRSDGSQSVLPLAHAVGTLSLTKIEYRQGKEWQHREAFRIRVKEGPAGTAPNWDDGGRVLTVFVPKAEVVRCRYASYFKEMDELDDMGIWQWIAEKGPPNIAELKQKGLDGRHWMLTPFRTVEFVHATQQPLGLPEFGSLKAGKVPGDTFATVVDKLKVSGKSTSKIDLFAEWSEPVDPLAEPKWKNIDGKAHVVELKVFDPDTVNLPLNSQHEFGDTKHRMVRYRAVATTRFREYLADELAKDDPSDPDKLLKNLTRTSEIVEKNILNSARPDAPKVLYIVPTFGWESGTEAGGKSSKRIGGGLRIWMDRPWFSSGEGELLGVMIWTGDFSTIPDKYKPYVTQWGVDPIWKSGPTSDGPSFNAFKGWHRDRSDVSLDELTTGLAALPLKTVNMLITTVEMEGFSAKSGKTTPKSEVVKSVPGIDAVQIKPGEKLFPQNKGTAKGPDPAKSAGSSPSGKYLKATTAEISENDLTQKVKDLDAIEKSHLDFSKSLGNVTIAKPTLAVVGHKVEYDEHRRLWYCDMEIDAGKSYYPFVRLALVRFQPDSVADALVSRVVLADFAQLAPDRAAAVIPDPADPRKLVLAVSGLTYSGSDAEDEKGGDIEVSVETRRLGVEDPDLAWVPAPDVNVELVQAPVKDGATLWGGLITLPEPRGSRPYRVVIKEYEKFINMSMEYSAGGSHFEQARFARRIVYADVVEI